MNDAKQRPEARDLPRPSQILQHAIVPPRPPRDLVHRLRLHRKILDEHRGQLVCIIAPAGCGKTTLLADLVASHFPTAIWIKITPDARDYIRLAELLQASLSAAAKPISLQLPSDLKPEELGRHIGELLKDRSAEGQALIIDDVHVIRDTPNPTALMHGMISTLKSSLPIFLAGRQLPHLGLAQLVVNNGLAIVDQQQLAFSPSEISEWWGLRRGCAIDNELLATLVQATSGWISGLRLVELSSRGSSAPTPGKLSDDFFFDLLQTLGQTLSVSDRSFLVESAVLPVMTAGGCDEVLDRSDSGRRLRQLEREGLVASAAGGHERTFEYHPLIRQALLSELEKGQAERVRQIRVKAAEYLLAHAAPEAAVELFFQAGAEERAVEVIEIESETCLHRGRIDTLIIWSKIITDRKKKAPSLFTHLGSSLAASGKYRKAGDAFKLARKMVSDNPSRDVLIDLELHSAYLDCYRGRYSTARRSINAAKSLSFDDEKDIRARITRLEGLLSYISQGDASHAYELIGESLKADTVDSIGYFRVAALNDMAMICDVLGRARESRHFGSVAKTLAWNMGDALSYIVTLNNVAADMHLEGQYSRSLSEYTKALSEIRRFDAPARKAIILLGIADLRMDIGQMQKAREGYLRVIGMALDDDNRRLFGLGVLGLMRYFRKINIEDEFPQEWLCNELKFGLIETDIEIEKYAGLIKRQPEPMHQYFRLILACDDLNSTFTHKIQAAYFSSLSALELGDEDLAVRLLGEAVCRAHDASLSQLLVSELRHAPAMVALLARTNNDSAQKGEIYDRLRRLERLRNSLGQTDLKEGRAPTYHLADLGSAEILDKGGRKLNLYPLDIEVLAFLHHRGGAGLMELGQEFWASARPQRQRSCTYSCIRRLRRVLGKGAVRLQNGVYSIERPDMIRSDGQEFQATVEALHAMPPGDPRRRRYLDRALVIYKGEFLPEASVPWAVKTRKRFAGLYCDVLVLSAQDHLLAGVPDKAFFALQRALRFSPYRDDASLAMLEALLRLGRNGDAYAFRQRYKERLATDLGIEVDDLALGEHGPHLRLDGQIPTHDLADQAGFRLTESEDHRL
jgi:tetratricopeptide (TPR) repeat protein